MIRIDEFYNHTIWPFLKNRVPLTRLYYCDPPGRSDPDSLCNRGNDATELNYILFHDQEPIHLDIHQPLFNELVRRNGNLSNNAGPKYKAIVTSEWNSEFVEQVCSQYGWAHYYYFFHGWAALDWYRGYDKTFLMTAPERRFIAKSFISPNRIVGGKRDHRIELMYHILKNNIKTAHISFPSVCPAENVSVLDLADKFSTQYPDIVGTFEQAKFPWNFRGETDHPMHSCWLSLFDQCGESLAYLVTETVFTGRRNHLTEKTFKPICLGMPFILVSTPGSLRYLRSYGFETFGDIWDESYDDELDDRRRIEKITKVLVDLENLSVEEKNLTFRRCLNKIIHNYNHFYHGNFEAMLWKEMTTMLEQIEQDFKR